MKKLIRKSIIFIILFCIIFLWIQRVLHYRWCGNEDLYTRNMLYKNEEPAGTIDVLYFGTSELYAGVAPIVEYAERGITGYNFCISNKSAITTYYQLKYALKYQKPKVVVCDFLSLFDDSLPSDVERIYRKVSDTMPDLDIKKELIEDLCSEDATQSKLSYYFPLLRYHSMWNELSKNMFQDDYIVSNEYKEYKKGTLLRNETYKAENIIEITEDLWKIEDEMIPYSDVSVKYYDKFIQLCKENDTKVVAVMPPKLSAADWKVKRWQEFIEYFESRDIDWIDYNNYDAVYKMQLNVLEDYYDGAHLNSTGAIKFSKQLATDLSNMYGLENHKGDSLYKKWDEQLMEFEEDYIIYQ